MMQLGCRGVARSLRQAAAFAAMLCCLGVSSSARADDAPAHCRYVKLSTLPLSFAASAQPEIEGSINSKPVPMMLDTGADQTILMRAQIEALGLPLRHLDHYSIGIGGEAAEYGAFVQELSIGAVHGGHSMFRVVDGGSLQSRFGGIIGADFLFQQDLEISYAAKQISFFHPLACADAFLAYWNPEASVLSFGPMSSTDTRPEFEVEVNGQKLRAIIDTGAWRTAIDVHAAARAGITSESAGVIDMGKGSGIGQHGAAIWSAPFDEVIIGAETIKHSRIVVMDMWTGALKDHSSAQMADWLRHQPEMVLGADFLRSHRVLFAMSQRRIYVSYEGGEVFCSACK